MPHRTEWGLTVPYNFDANMFDRLANDAQTWFGSADTLMMSALFVWERRRDAVRAEWVALMLRGYAVENLLKGLWVEQGKVIAKGGKRQQIPNAADHELVPLANAAGLSLDETTRGMLHSLSASMKFLGRYPFPNQSKEMPVHTPERSEPKAQWGAKYERAFWSLVEDVSGRFSFWAKTRTANEPPGSGAGERLMRQRLAAWKGDPSCY